MDARITDLMPTVSARIKNAGLSGGTISATGYDNTVANIPARDGVALSAHHDIVMTGQRPAVELYAVIGAAYVEAQGRWPQPHSPAIPRIAGVVLRDRLDLDRLMLIGDSLICRGEIVGKRSYLAS